MSADSFCLERFEPLVGTPFGLQTGATEPLLARLVEARRGHGDTLPGRASFSLIFEGPREPLLPQRIYRLEHAQMEALEIFLVPVARTDHGIRYEAVFG